MPLSLTDAQLATVTDIAQALVPSGRARELRAEGLTESAPSLVTAKVMRNPWRWQAEHNTD
jgi:hypothetical protein